MNLEKCLSHSVKAVGGGTNKVEAIGGEIELSPLLNDPSMSEVALSSEGGREG